MQFYPQRITIYALLLQNVLPRFTHFFRKLFNDKKTEFANIVAFWMYAICFK